MKKIVKSEQEWRDQLTPDQFEITRRKGTEPAFSGEYYNLKDRGTYRCICCNNELFSSESKYDSGTGWPSFFKPFSDGSLEHRSDNGFFMKRTEVICSKCDAHLGHMFHDGPEPTGKRYCINSLSLNFEPASRS